MGVGYHGLQLLRFAAKHAKLGRVATIGRQDLGLDSEEVRSILKIGPEYEHEKYCDSVLMRYFGASTVDSWDYSDYEGASRICDMNKPLNGAASPYDTVIDYGSLEHVYNAPQALLNVSNLCREGGQILHQVPGNNFCGHGFWQFSPELFFSLYSQENGYSDTRVFLASEYRTDIWYEVAKPQNGQRVNVVSFTPIFVLCRTVKGRNCSHDRVQQSDYLHLWQKNRSTPAEVETRPVWRSKVRSALQSSGFVDFAYFLHVKLSGKRALSARNPHLTARSISLLAN